MVHTSLMLLQRLLITAVAFVLPFSIAHGSDWAGKGELLSYKVKFGFFNLGYAELAYRPSAEGQGYSIIGKAWSEMPFYMVRDRWSAQGMHSQDMPFETAHFKVDQIENNYRADKELVLKRADDVAIFTNHHAHLPEERVTLLPAMRDYLSALYYIRAEAMVDDLATLELPVIGVDKTYTMRVRHIRTENVHTPWGKREALVLAPEFIPLGEEAAPVAKDKDDYPWLMWVTNDTQRYPVKLQANMKIGKITASLTKVSSAKASKAPQGLPDAGKISPPDPAKAKHINPISD